MESTSKDIIKDVTLHQLTKVNNPLGDLFHVAKSEQFISTIREIYCSTVLPRQVKAWKKHTKMTQQLVVPVGDVEFVLFDDRDELGSKNQIQTIIIGEANYQRLTIPPNIWYGFKANSDTTALIINTPDLLHDPNEVVRLPIDNDLIPYNWDIK